MSAIKQAMADAGFDPARTLREKGEFLLEEFGLDWRGAVWAALGRIDKAELIELFGGSAVAFDRMKSYLAQLAAERRKDGGEEAKRILPEGQASYASPAVAGTPARAGEEGQNSPADKAKAEMPSSPTPSGESRQPGETRPELPQGRVARVSPAPNPPKPSTVTRAAVVSLHEWRQTFNKRRFAEVKVNGRPWYLAKSEELLASSEMDHIHGRFKEFLGRVGMKNPRTPIGEVLTPEEFDAAVSYAEKGNA